MKIYIARDTRGLLGLFLTKPRFNKKYQEWRSPGESHKILPTELLPEIEPSKCWEFPVDMKHGKEV